MIKLLLAISIISLSALVHAEDDLCGYFKYCGSSSSPSRSSVNTSTSSILNPSNLAKIKGLGLETLYQQNNPFAFSIVTGNGRVGAALISPTLENSFFGIRSLELDYDYYLRYIERKRYMNKKINFATGIGLINSKNFTMELGISVRRNPDVKNINPGVGLNTQIGPIHLGAYVYKDDVKLDFKDYADPVSGLNYASIYGSSSYQESYLVKTMNLGVEIKNLSLDVAYLNTKYSFYREDTRVMLYTAAYRFGQFMFNYGIRKEESPNYAITAMNQPSNVRQKEFHYFGVQFIPTKRVMLGFGRNTFLTDEFSFTLTLFLN